MNVDEFLKRDISRRQFLGRSAQNAAGMAAGMAAGIVGLTGAVAKAMPNERVSVGVIGVRAQGKVLASRLTAFGDVDVTDLCDVDERVLANAVKVVEETQGAAGISPHPPRRHQDFRRLLDDPSIDAVVIATPDHWHALMAAMACRAGKHVYVENPISHNIIEGQHLAAAAKTSERVVQAGLQQRSIPHFQTAVDFVRSGQLGAVKLAKAWTAHRRKPIDTQPDGRPPAHVDYDLWLGPAPQRPFNPARFHHNWHWFWDYGTGELGNWGVHMLDIARWGLEVDLPMTVASTGGKYHFHDARETPDTQIVQFTYPGKTIVWEHRMWSNHGIEGRSAAAAFYGERGTLVVDRSGWKVYDRKESASSDATGQATAHQRRFIDNIKAHIVDNNDLDAAHISSTLCHLGNIAHRLGRQIHFDATNMNFGADTEANTLLGREHRAPWTIED